MIGLVNRGESARLLVGFNEHVNRSLRFYLTQLAFQRYDWLIQQGFIHIRDIFSGKRAQLILILSDCWQQT